MNGSVRQQKHAYMLEVMCRFMMIMLHLIACGMKDNYKGFINKAVMTLPINSNLCKSFIKRINMNFRNYILRITMLF